MTTMSAELIDPGQPELGYDVTGGVSEGLQALRERITQRLLFPRGTWELDGLAGTDLIVGHRIATQLAERVISDTIRDEGGNEIVEVVVSKVELNASTRTFSYAATIVSTHGNTTLSGELIAA